MYKSSRLTPRSSDDNILKILGRSVPWSFYFLTSYTGSSLSDFFSAVDFESPTFLRASDSYCFSAKHHSCLPENKNHREKSGQRIKACRGFVWQIVTGVLLVKTHSLSLSVFVSLSLYVHTLRAPPSHCQLENYRSWKRTVPSQQPPPWSWRLLITAHVCMSVCECTHVLSFLVRSLCAWIFSSVI